MKARRLALSTASAHPIEVWGNTLWREFRVQGATQAWWHRERFLTGYAWDLIAASVLIHSVKPPRSILMLGLGGGTSLRTLRNFFPDTRFVAIEMDKEIVRLANLYMELKKVNVEIHYADAYAWLKRNREKFDVVIDDVYAAGAEDVSRPLVWGEAETRAILSALATGGMLSANLVTGSGHLSMQRAFRKWFRQRGVEDQRYSYRLTTPRSLNEILVSTPHALARGILKPHRSRFTASHDRKLWDMIRLVKI